MFGQIYLGHLATGVLGKELSLVTVSKTEQFQAVCGTVLVNAVTGRVSDYATNQDLENCAAYSTAKGADVAIFAPFGGASQTELGREPFQ